jgi:excisionase family DNA binding protein
MTGLEIVLNALEAAELLRMHPVTVRGLAKEGLIPAKKIGKEWRFNKLALLDWLGGEHSPVKIIDDERANTSWHSDKTQKVVFGKSRFLLAENAIKEAQTQQLRSTRRNLRTK